MTGTRNDSYTAPHPTEAEAEVAKESSRQLAMGLPRAKKLHLEVDTGKTREAVVIPPAAARLLQHILTEMGQGNAVALVPIHAELTTQEAADLLNVSRPYLVKLLDEGAIPSHKVGTHRRVSYTDLMDYKEKDTALRLKALEELSALDQELGLGYKP